MPEPRRDLTHIVLAVMFIGGREAIAGRMTSGDLMAFTFYLALVVGPIVQIVGISTQLSEAFAGLERIREILGEEREDEHDLVKPPVHDIDGHVTLREVTSAVVYPSVGVGSDRLRQTQRAITPVAHEC